MKNWNDFINASGDAILSWADSQAWAHSMAACAQDATWHAEGDVWTHTRMVCAQLQALEEWQSLDRQQQTMLLFTGLFHDSGKPATTLLDPATGRIRSPHHASAGVSIARAVLREIGCRVETRERICALVAFHGRPPYLLERQSPEHEVIRLSWLTDNRLLYLFTLADTRGRNSVESSRPEENLHLWKLVAEEQGCFDRPFAFANDHARFLFYRNQLSHPSYAPYEDFRCTVTIVSGLPGAGKDTWLLRNRPETPVVSLDEIRGDLDLDPTDNQGAVVQAARERCREFLRAGINFSVNATNVSTMVRKRWIDLCADYGARVEIVYVEPRLEMILERNKRRAVPVPQNVIHKLVSMLEPPTVAECHRLTVVDE